MKNMVMAMAASAGIMLAPISPAFAGTVVTKDADVALSAWVPATQAEQEAARGGFSGGQYYTVTNVLSVFCKSLTVRVRFCKYQGET